MDLQRNVWNRAGVAFAVAVYVASAVASDREVFLDRCVGLQLCDRIEFRDMEAARSVVEFFAPIRVEENRIVVLSGWFSDLFMLSRNKEALADWLLAHEGAHLRGKDECEADREAIRYVKSVWGDEVERVTRTEVLALRAAMAQYAPFKACEETRDDSIVVTGGVDACRNDGGR